MKGWLYLTSDVQTHKALLSNVIYKFTCKHGARADLLYVSKT